MSVVSLRRKEYLRQWRENHREQAREASKQWRRNNREKHREDTRQYRLNHPKKHCENQKRYRKNNPEKTKVHNVVWSHPEKYPLDDKCVFCGRTEKLEHGHLDYEDNGDNYVTVCHQCNHWMGVD